MTESTVIILALKMIREKAFRMHCFQSHIMSSMFLCIMNVGVLKVISFNTCKYGELSKNVQTKIHRTVILPVVLYGCETGISF
jgi:hypothetical protein